MSSNLDFKRVLSIQSTVVHGYVGNKSAVFPLQVLGMDVDPINSVQFSNHTGYKSFKGQVLNSQELNDLFEGLQSNNLHSSYSHLLTGYVGNDTFLRQIKEIITMLREANPNITYVCDPVMGDDGFMYVPKELLPIYRDEIIPLADISTPNQYEVELLTGKKVVSESDAWAALNWFHQKGVKIVVMSSSDIGGSNILITCLSVKKSDNEIERYKLTIPKQGGHVRFTGVGDLFAALFLANTAKYNSDFGKALELTIASVQSVIGVTLDVLSEDEISGKTKITAQRRELKIIQSKSHIENPTVKLKAVKVELKS